MLLSGAILVWMLTHSIEAEHVIAILLKVAKFLGL